MYNTGKSGLCQKAGPGLVMIGYVGLLENLVPQNPAVYYNDNA